MMLVQNHHLLPLLHSSYTNEEYSDDEDDNEVETPNPRTQTPDSELQTLNLKSSAPTPKPEALNPQPSTPSLSRYTSHMTPGEGES